MAWVQPLYTKGEVNRASRVLVDSDASFEDYFRSLAVVNNWRAAHGFPLNTFQTTLRRKTRQVDPFGDVVQRIKRLRSIEAKLQRFAGDLAQMQDIGGCRAVVATVDHVDQLWGEYRSMRQAHKLVRFKDYLRDPKDDGYRSVHLVFRYFTRRSATAWNSLLIEIQIRSRPQHAWATAVETVDTFTGEGIKAGKGRADWRRFFALMSTYIALTEEGLPPVPNTPMTLPELCDELVPLIQELDVVARLSAYGAAMQATEAGTSASKDAFWFILDRKPGEVALYSYPKRSYAQASEHYAALEGATVKDPNRDVVLVSADSVTALRRAYPNYYADTTDFVQMVLRAIDDGH